MKEYRVNVAFLLWKKKSKLNARHRSQAVEFKSRSEHIIPICVCVHAGQGWGLAGVCVCEYKNVIVII